MKLAFTTLGCPDWDLDTMLRRAKEYGFDGIDFRGCAGEMDLWKLPEFSTGLDTTARRIRDAGLEAPCLSSSARLLCDDDDARATSADNFAHFAAIAGALGATGVRVFGGFNRERSYDDALREAAGALDDLAREGARHGVDVLVETHDDWIATDKLAALLDAATEPNVDAIWDINHPFCTAGETPEQSWVNFGPHVKYTHVKDTRPNEGGKRTPCLLGEGDVPVGEIVALLRREGYDGWLAYEWEKKWHPEIEAPEVAFPHYVRSLRSIIG